MWENLNLFCYYILLLIDLGSHQPEHLIDAQCRVSWVVWQVMGCGLRRERAGVRQSDPGYYSYLYCKDLFCYNWGQIS